MKRARRRAKWKKKNRQQNGKCVKFELAAENWRRPLWRQSKKGSRQKSTQTRRRCGASNSQLLKKKPISLNNTKLLRKIVHSFIIPSLLLSSSLWLFSLAAFSFSFTKRIISEMIVFLSFLPLFSLRVLKCLPFFWSRIRFK